MIYLITFACYGCHLHGGEYGSVDRNHNIFGTPFLEAGPALAAFESRQMDQAPYCMDERRREAVLGAIVETCEYHGWALWAAHVRSNHVHSVVQAGVSPERVMFVLKAFASRRLNELGLDAPGRKRWGRHGSTRWLHAPEQVAAAVQYVLAEQGPPMAVWPE
ncbi:transposase [uncultured Paludibaculum sp.]|uniref:transposase n=1 Tax=uncultured Paludibaculum sp. TaxID=1765020 RepID=UPI002AABB1F6|nr:transposase [uncultured Paludibaculum sp.]